MLGCLTSNPRLQLQITIWQITHVSMYNMKQSAPEKTGRKGVTTTVGQRQSAAMLL